MRRIIFVIFVLLLVPMLGGRTAHLSSVYRRDYTFAMYESGFATVEMFTPCASSAPRDAAEGRSWCTVPNGQVETLRQITIAVIKDVTAADEDCKFTIETSPDLSSWTSIASSAISTGSNLTNAAGVCAAGELVLDVVGEFCQRTLADGVTVAPGGGWRIGMSTTGTCTTTNGLGAYVTSTIQ